MQYDENTQIKSSKRVPVTSPGEEEKPGIYGCCFMPNGYLLLCDSNNSKLKLLNESFEMKEEIEVDRFPYNVSVIDDNNVIITLPNIRQLQYVQVFPHLKAGRVIHFDKDCVGVDVSGDEIYITCHDNPGKGEVRILNLNGEVKKPTVGVRQDGSFMFERPDKLAVSKTSGNIFVLDEDAAIVSCLSADGQIIYRYEDEGLKKPRGLLLGAGDNAFVCLKKSRKVQVIAADGRKSGTLVLSDDRVFRPHSMAYRHSDRTLVVGWDWSDNIFCFKLD